MKFATAFIATVSAAVGDESDLYKLPVCVTNADCDDQVENVEAILGEIAELTDEERAVEGLACATPMVEEEALLGEAVCMPTQACGEALNLEYEDAREIINFTCAEDAAEEGNATRLAATVGAAIAAFYAL